jgi:hypothetical protein
VSQIGPSSSIRTTYSYVVGGRWGVGSSQLTTYDIPSNLFVFNNIPAFIQLSTCVFIDIPAFGLSFPQRSFVFIDIPALLAHFLMLRRSFWGAQAMTQCLVSEWVGKSFVKFLRSWQNRSRSHSRLAY